MSTFNRIQTLSEMFKLLELPSPKHPLIAILDYAKTPVTTTVPEQKTICDFYQISFKGDKGGSLGYGRNSYDYQEGSIIYVGPGQVVTYGVASSEVTIDKGWSLFFHPDLIRTFSLGDKIKEYGFFNYTINEALHVSEKEREVIHSILEKIELELESNIDDFSEELIVSNLELLLNYSKRFYNRQFITRKRFSGDIIIRFQHLLDQYFADDLQKELGVPTVQYFADKCDYSANYLSDLIRKGTDKSILEHVHSKLIDLAKNKLLNSNLSVSEIAHVLGFEYPQYFSRLFKKKTGMTPTEYRKVS
ncbi:hypothetical protein BKI52_09260 [marine bacterium AO1-C]|nr:hypothetical protein BKI52_09260 [marine bacterium AO1-C]